jgi:outer membrane protein
MQVLAEISIPLYDGGTTFSKSRALQATKSEREQQLEDARQAAVELADSAWDLLDATRRSRDALNEEIHQQTVAVAGVKHDQSLGLRTIFEVISQEQSLFQSRINLVQAQRDAIIYEAALLRAVGELTAESLNLPVDLYDPQKNLDVVHHEWFGFHTAE